MVVEYIARDEVITADPATPAAEIAATMADEGVGSVVLVEEDELVGIVTDRDVGLRIWDHGDPEKTTADELMTPDPVTVEAGTDIYSALRTAREAGVRRLPVIEEGELVGIMSVDDVLVLLAGELEEISGIIQGHSPPYS